MPGKDDPALFGSPSSFFNVRSFDDDALTKDDIERLESKMDEILKRLDLIFGDHVLVNGRLVSLGLFLKEKNND